MDKNGWNPSMSVHIHSIMTQPQHAYEHRVLFISINLQFHYDLPKTFHSEQPVHFNEFYHPALHDKHFLFFSFAERSQQTLAIEVRKDQEMRNVIFQRNSDINSACNANSGCSNTNTELVVLVSALTLAIVPII